jgi:hypothetical protein
LNALPLTASIPSRAPLRSLGAYVVPRFVEVTAAARGAVTSVLLGPREVVRRGQAVATLELLGSHGANTHGTVAVRAPVTGLVSRCWASPGEVVGPASPIMSVASAENVLVVAKFPAGSALRLGSAMALLHPAAREAVPATIVSIIDSPNPGRGARRSPTRVVISFTNAPAEVLWPGTPVRVDIQL